MTAPTWPAHLPTTDCLQLPWKREPDSYRDHPVRSRLGPEHDAPLHDHDTAVQDNAEHREDDEEGEDGRDLQVGIVDQEQIAESAASTNEFSDNRSNDAEDDPDIETGEDEGKCGRQPDESEDLPPCCFQRYHQVEPVLLHMT